MTDPDLRQEPSAPENSGSGTSSPNHPVSLQDTAELRPPADLLPAALDGLLFVHHQPLAMARIAELLGLSPEAAEDLVRTRKDACDQDPSAGLQIIVNEQGVQLATKACISRFIQRLEGQKLVSLSLPALETLAVIAVKQPVTRPEIDAIRGVNSDGVVSTLLDKKLIAVSGEKPVVGRPRLYSTTPDFLYYFGLKSLQELPVPAVDFPPDFLADQKDLEAEKREASNDIESSQGLRLLPDPDPDPGDDDDDAMPQSAGEGEPGDGSLSDHVPPPPGGTPE